MLMHISFIHGNLTLPIKRNEERTKLKVDELNMHTLPSREIVSLLDGKN